MRRVNIQAAFVGEPSFASEASEPEEGDEAVVLTVRAGELTLVVPPGTPDERVLEVASTLRGSLHLENERVLTFEIQEGAVGAFFEDEAVELHRRQEESGGVGLFAAPPAALHQAGASVRAKDLMTTSLVTVTPDLAVEAAAALLAFHRVSGLPVVDGDQLVGLVTEADVIGKPGASVAEIMTHEVVTVAEETPALDVANLLVERGIRRAPVLSQGKLVGIISRGDIVRWVASRGRAF